MALKLELLLTPDFIFDGNKLLENHSAQCIEGVIKKIFPSDSIKTKASKLQIKGILAPGFVDLQVNGGGGILLNNNPSMASMIKILNSHRQFGTAAILPTIISDNPEILKKATQATIDLKSHRNLIGLHIEGPHILTDRRGVHSLEYVRPFEDETLSCIEKLRAKSIPTMITVAPDVVSCDIIKALSETGAIVSLGHTNATMSQTEDALASGAKAFTHLFNAMPPMLSRNPGIVAAAINSNAYVSIIGDGFHVADAMIKLALRARPTKDRTFIISDAMPTIGGPNEFSLYGEKIFLQQGRLTNKNGNLAGAHITVAKTVSRLINILRLDPEQILRMAISIPANLISRPDLGKLVGRKKEDIIILDSSYNFVCKLNYLIK